jgi:malate dehydrogenase (oxaloacetate-decarboxylating)
MNIPEQALELHKTHKGKWAMHSKVTIDTRDDLSLAYSPGVAEPCLKIAQDPSASNLYTAKSNVVAVISNGTAVLGLGDIGPRAAMPVMEGKSILFKRFADIDSIPLVVDEQNPEKLIEIIRAISPSFGGINLEDIKAPECFIIESALQDLGIPVVHDDQHGTAIVVVAGLINAIKVSNKHNPLRVVIVGAGAAGNAIAQLIHHAGLQNILLIEDIVVCDSKGIVSHERTDMDSEKMQLLEFTNTTNQSGTVHDAMRNSDIVIGVSKPNGFVADDITVMNADPIVFALANPIPEVMPVDAAAAGCRVMATGRSDFPNQVNNVLAFPGLFRGLLDSGATRLTIEHKLAAAVAIAGMVDNPTVMAILPDIFDNRVVTAVSSAIQTIEQDR